MLLEYNQVWQHTISDISAWTLLRFLSNQFHTKTVAVPDVFIKLNMDRIETRSNDVTSKLSPTTVNDSRYKRKQDFLLPIEMLPGSVGNFGDMLFWLYLSVYVWLSMSQCQ